MKACDFHGLEHGSLRRAKWRVEFHDCDNPTEPPEVLDVCSVCGGAMRDSVGLDKFRLEYSAAEKREGEMNPDGAT